ncbi:MAG TPA: hypothetical protein PK627_10335 [Bacteroidales bacterium]|nr:hypothetical protein [Bacteroidales bacterium]
MGHGKPLEKLGNYEYRTRDFCTDVRVCVTFFHRVTAGKTDQDALNPVMVVISLQIPGKNIPGRGESRPEPLKRKRR